MNSVWFVAGAVAGAYATTKARRAAEALTVDGIHDRLTGWFAGARVLADEVRAGAAQKETELRARLAAVPDGGTATAVPAGAAAAVPESDNVRQLAGRRPSIGAAAPAAAGGHDDTRKGDA